MASGGILVFGGDDAGTVQLIGVFDASPELETTAPLPFPNPANNTVTWEGTDPAASTWMHLGGQRMDVPYLGQGRWDVSGLPAGMYLLGTEHDGVPVYRRLSVR